MESLKETLMTLILKPDVAPTLPPDPENMNGDRAEWAEVAIEAFERATGTDREDALADLLCNLMHWCDRNPEQDFNAMLERACLSYRQETQA